MPVYVSICMYFCLYRDLLTWKESSIIYGLFFFPLWFTCSNTYGCSATALLGNAGTYGKHEEECWFLGILPCVLSTRKEGAVCVRIYTFFFLAFRLSRSKFIAQVQRRSQGSVYLFHWPLTYIPYVFFLPFLTAF